MKTVSGNFVKSVAVGGVLPHDTGPVVAMVGRSNVGKSSLINTLVKSPIARSGSTPGTTRLLNLYYLNFPQQVRTTFVDLPGYGYARGGSKTNHLFEELTTDFFTRMVSAQKSENTGTVTPFISGIILLVDIRHPGLESDQETKSWLTANGYPLIIVATKIDKLSRSQLSQTHRKHELCLESRVLPVSNKTTEGISPVRLAIINLLKESSR